MLIWKYVQSVYKETRQGGLALSIHIDSMLEQMSGSEIVQPILYTSTVNTDFLLLCGSKFQLKHAPASNKKVS